MTEPYCRTKEVLSRDEKVGEGVCQRDGERLGRLWSDDGKSMAGSLLSSLAENVAVCLCQLHGLICVTFGLEKVKAVYCFMANGKS